MNHQPNRPVVVITGASAGVGRATARAFGREGASIGLIARGVDALAVAQREIESAGGRALVLPLDVADWEAMDRAATAVEEQFGSIDVWINNAMASVFSPFMEMTPEEFKRVTEVTYLGYVHGTLAALHRMKPRNRGVIIQVGSALAYRGIPLQSAYCGAKHAIEGFTESVRCELMHEGSQIRLTLVNLPAMNTPQFSWVKSRLPRKPQPVPPIYQPEIAARAILWAAKHARRELNVGMPTSVVVAGNKLAPGLGDWYLARTGYDSQMLPERAEEGRPHNLWQPLPGDHGAHGDFDDRAHRRSLQLWATTHRGLVAALGVGAAALVACLWKGASRGGAARSDSRGRAG